jgi:outer membrane protein assembly factor BamE (lipoprotein component of BamABCDE complex)
MQTLLAASRLAHQESMGRVLGNGSVWRTPAKLLAVVLLASSLAGCLGYDGELSHGFQADPQALADVKAGSSAEQVLVLLGTPSTTSTVGGDAWYYISQKTQRQLAFMQPKLVDQRIVAVYFDKSKKVTRIANYSMDDGKVVDFSSRTTPTSGAEGTFLKNMMLSMMRVGGG